MIAVLVSIGQSESKALETLKNKDLTADLRMLITKVSLIVLMSHRPPAALIAFTYNIIPHNTLRWPRVQAGGSVDKAQGNLLYDLASRVRTTAWLTDRLDFFVDLIAYDFMLLFIANAYVFQDQEADYSRSVWRYVCILLYVNKHGADGGRP